jgi:Ni/Fe-hydrogenase subunit HybB-like protein
MTNAYTFICLYLIFGTCFGLATFSKRHLFSEGPHKAKDNDQTSSLKTHIFWTMVCTLLWPIMVITGINTAWIFFKRKQQSRK